MAKKLRKPPKAGHNSRVPLYRTYMFMDKDPVIDVMRTLVDDTSRSYGDIADDCGVSTQTLYNWFNGRTRRPQFCTLAAVAGACGKEFGLINKRRA